MHHAHLLGDRHIFVGDDVAAIFHANPGQDFDGLDLAADDIDDRLEEGHHAALFDGIENQHALFAEGAEDVDDVLFVGHHHPILSLGLGAIHHVVGKQEQILHRLGVVGVGGHAD